MQEKLMSDQTRLTTEQLTLAEERAKLDALANLQGLSGAVSFDMLQVRKSLTNNTVLLLQDILKNHHQ